MLRRIVAHWISGLSLADFKAELAAVRKVKARREGERREADAAAWRALANVQNEEDEAARGANWKSIFSVFLGRRH
ncbi:MAG TPA: hypothetical protein VEU53_09750 [Stellaceae bacterium]|nr:hypothetical protein [Stellaceae bacterium]